MHSDKELGQMALILLFSRSIGILWVMISFVVVFSSLIKYFNMKIAQVLGLYLKTQMMVSLRLSPAFKKVSSYLTFWKQLLYEKYYCM
uniref:Uncharacterized protein n=1 Tax=Manihot esculenta TaxID=3983 RepID=A0A2C9UZW2_MANES